MFYFVQAAKPIVLPAGTPTQSPGPLASTGAGAGPGNHADRFWLPFVSNTVAHAIAAGLVKEPFALKAWAAAAKQAAMELDGQREPGQDDNDPDF